MGLEVFNFIDSLVITNPVGATDPKSQGDDHLRGIKTVLTNSFPNFTGAMTLTDTALNNAAIKTDALNAFLAITATTYDGIAAANLVDRSAANVFNAQQNIAGGFGLQLRDASGVDSVTINHDGSIVNSAYVNAVLHRHDTVIEVNDAAVAQFQMSIATVQRGVLNYRDAASQIELNSDGGIAFFGNNIDRCNMASSGAITTPNNDAGEFGWKGAPQNIQNGNYTLLLTDAARSIYKASGGAGETITIPANGAVAFPIGTIVVIQNDGGGDLSIAITTDTLEKYGGATGTQTLGDNNKAVIEKVTATLWKYSSTD